GDPPRDRDVRVLRIGRWFDRLRPAGRDADLAAERFDRERTELLLVEGEVERLAALEVDHLALPSDDVGEARRPGRGTLEGPAHEADRVQAVREVIPGVGLDRGPQSSRQWVSGGRGQHGHE